MSVRKHIPNAITSLNVLCGIVGVVFAFKGRLDTAFALMLAGAFFDYFDGFAARMLGAYSPMGKELDSLADLTTFGILPSVMMYVLMSYSTCSEALCLIPLIYAVFSALRLAKFNVDERQNTSFLGIPTPAGAMLIGSLCSFVRCTPSSFLAGACSTVWFIPALAVALSLLLVSEMPAFSFKISKDHKADKSTSAKRILLLAAGVLAVAFVCINGFRWTLAVFLIFACYILMNIIFRIFRV